MGEPDYTEKRDGSSRRVLFWPKKSQVVYANLQRDSMEPDQAGTQDDDDDEREIRISRGWIAPPA